MAYGHNREMGCGLMAEFLATELQNFCTNVVAAVFTHVLQFTILQFRSLRRIAMASSLLDQLTSRQAAVFEFIKEKVQTRGYGPTVREIGEHFQISSPNGVMCHLRALERKQLLRRVRKHDRAIARAIELAPEIMAEDKGMPLVGTVA